MTERPTAPAVDHAIEILKLLVNSPFSLTITEICDQTELSSASCYRIINSLLAQNLITHDPSRKKAYCTGSSIFQMASIVYNKQIILPYFYPIAEILKNEIYHPVLLSSQIGDNTVIVARVGVFNSNYNRTFIGYAQPLYKSSAGKAILSIQKDNYINNYIKYLIKNSLLNDQEIRIFKKDLERAKRLGYVVTHGEINQDGSCISAVVRSLSQQPIGAITIFIPQFELTSEEIRSYSVPLIQAAKQLSSRIG
jgi:IclR family transcriptional regulator, KDG regulon repressor